MKDTHLNHYDAQSLSTEDIEQLGESDVILIGTQRFFRPLERVFYLDDQHQKQYGVLHFGEIGGDKEFYITLEDGSVLIVDAQERVYEDKRG